MLAADRASTAICRKHFARYLNNSGYLARTSAASSREVVATLGKVSIRS
jgi:hypothetical protein